MSHLIEVAFRGNRKEFFQWQGETAPPLKAGVIVEADRGEDFGHVHSTGQLAHVRCNGCAHGCGTTPPPRFALRLSTRDEDVKAQSVSADNEDARRKSMERAKALGLVMKVSDAEWQWDRRKLTLYFTAERRVDFRNLVRDLASMFRARIELKQIGVRDEAKRLGGIGRCGREYCSASWLPDLRPVNLGVAKDQRLSLNPQQISGACGRLMCCLRYEHEFYVQSRRRFPKEGKILRTAVGDEKVIACDIFNERITLRTAEGDTRVVLLAELREQVGGFGDSTAVDRTETADAGAANSTRDRDDFVPDHDAPVGPVTLSSHTNVREEEDDDEPNAFDDAVDDGLDDALDEDEEPSGIDAEASEGASVTSPGESAEARRKRRRGRRGGRRLRAADARRSGEHPTVQPPAPDRNATDADGHGGSDGAPSRTPLT